MLTGGVMLMIGVVLMGMSLDLHRDPLSVGAEVGRASAALDRSQGISWRSPPLPGIPGDRDFVGTITLGEGYHKSAVVWCGGMPVVSCFDSGSYRNIIQEAQLQVLETAGGSVVCRRPCEPTHCEGFSTAGGVT